MLSRKQKIETLLEDLKLLRRTMTFRVAGSANIHKITPSQWGVLMFVEQRGTVTVKDAAKALGITSSAATQLIDGLVSNGYVTRGTDPVDHRIVTLTLSKKSKNHVDIMKRIALQRFLKIFKVLNDKEFDQYLALNKKIVTNLMIV
jgi:DNA-binding MarR family transcriptional regulator